MSEERKVFVSYSRRDKEKVFPLVKDLEKSLGCKFWIDWTGIESGNPNFYNEIAQGIDDAKVVLYMHTTNAAKSLYTQRELAYAEKVRTKIIPVLFEDLTKGLALQFAATNFIDIRETGQIQKLINDLRGYLNLSNSADRSTTMDISTTEKKEKSTSAPNTIAGHKFVDLGLSVKWATCNVGANSPEEYGDYYAWGETSTKSSYSKNNCETYRKSIGDIKGTDRDVAHVKWGGSWRMPTKAELEELVNNCVWTWTTRNGVKGYKVTGVKTGDLSNFIFLPAEGGCRSGKYLFYKGLGFYWSSDSDKYSSVKAHILSLDNCKKYWVSRDERSVGCLVRPVTE